MQYEHKKIEKKWKKKWEERDAYKTADATDKPKYYILDMFPYPSGAGLHVGHPKGYIATDIYARLKMMQGFNVLHPMGWDAFGLPAENYAIQHKIHPRTATGKNVATFKKQLGQLGLSYDWSREINTTDPEYYKWTQWIFLQMFKRGLAYESFEPINWCPDCQTGLAGEDLEDGKCERCGSVIERKPMRQWALSITDYAERLLSDLEKLPHWEESIKEMQKNWIGRSEGALIKFPISNFQFPNKSKFQNLEIQNLYIEVFTTRPDTLFGCTYMVVAPEHQLIKKLEARIENLEEAKKYIEQAKHKTELDRAELQKEKTGLEIKGIKAINPVNNEEIPVFVADYVLPGYGTGAIMAVPAHDQRDHDFAMKYGLPIRQVIISYDEYENQKSKIKNQNDNLKFKKLEISAAFEGDGINISSDFLDGSKTKEAKEKMVEWLEKNGKGRYVESYKLKDWVFSRQRYWGEPFPIVFCENCKNKKYDYLILHGYGAGPEDNFFPWLKAELESAGHKVTMPELPNPKSPDVYEQLELVKQNYKIGPDTIVIGHSLGGAVGMKLAEQSDKKIHKLILVDSFIRDEFSDPVFAKMKKKFDFKFDFGKIRENCEKIIMLADAEFKVIPKNHVLGMAKALGTAPLIRWPKGWHFCGREEPDVLKQAEISGWVPLPESELPLKLPEVKHYQPSGTGESPLSNIIDWVNTTCPACGGPARRETNTMPQWAGSCWYYLRYEDPHNGKVLVDGEKEKYWSPVDFYVGGAEHATRHLIYSRFWHKFLYDIGAVNYDEPFTRLQHVGLILAEDGRKMSKRWGNVVNPDDVVEKYGADAMRCYEMFMGPFSQPCAWNKSGLIGVRKFLEKVYSLKSKVKNHSPHLQHAAAGKPDVVVKNSKLDNLLHKTIKKVGEDIEQFKLNTAVSAMMILVNAMNEEDEIQPDHYEALLKVLAPFAPHLCEESWEEIRSKNLEVRSIFSESWPAYDPALIRDDTFQLVIQVNGKVRDTIEVSADISEAEAKERAVMSGKIKKWVDGKEIFKMVYVKGKLINIVID